MTDKSIGRAPKQMSPNAARAITDRIKSAADELAALLLEAHEGRAWKALGYPSWRVYAATEFNKSQSRVYQLLNQAQVILALEEASGSTLVEIGITEREARDLKPHMVEIVDKVRDRVADAPVERHVEIVRGVVAEERQRVIEGRAQSAQELADEDESAVIYVASLNRLKSAKAELKQLISPADYRRMAVCIDGFVQASRDLLSATNSQLQALIDGGRRTRLDDRGGSTVRLRTTVRRA